MNNSKTVLITGASTGIGYELTKLFAQDGYNLALVARNENRLNEIKKELYDDYKIQIKVIAKDLSLPNSSQEIFDEIVRSNMKVDVLVNNAGVGSSGLFHSNDIEKDIEMINLNITALTYLTKLFVKEMIKNGSGKILNVASNGAFQPGPYVAVYYATKAYVLSFSEAIANELKDFGIDVIIFCPGATKTEFARKSGKTDLPSAMRADVAASIAYKGFIKNKRVVIPGTGNKIFALLAKLLPRSASANIVRKTQEKRAKEYEKALAK